MTLQTLSRFCRQPAVPLLAALVMLSGWAGLAGARTEPFGERVEIRIPRPGGPVSSDAMARRIVARFDKAALLACGGSDDSFPQVKDAIRQSACWHSAMDSAVRQADDARLGTWWAARAS